MSSKLVTLDYGTLSPKASKQVKVLVQTWWPKFNSCKPHSGGKNNSHKLSSNLHMCPSWIDIHVVKHGHRHTRIKETKQKPNLNSNQKIFKKGLREGWNKSGLVTLWTFLLSEHRGCQSGVLGTPSLISMAVTNIMTRRKLRRKGFHLQLTGHHSGKWEQELRAGAEAKAVEDAVSWLALRGSLSLPSYRT